MDGASGHAARMGGDEGTGCTLTFERSASPYYGEAVRLARAIPGYCQVEVEGDVRHTVPLTVATAPLLERLLRLVLGWRGAVVHAGGLALYGGEMLRLLGMLTCYRGYERSRLGVLHCWGLPERGRGRVPCRLIDAALPWEPPDDFADAQLRPELVQALATDTFAVLCPVYDCAPIENAIAAWMGAAAHRSSFERLLDDLDVDLT